MKSLIHVVGNQLQQPGRAGRIDALAPDHREAANLASAYLKDEDQYGVARERQLGMMRERRQEPTLWIMRRLLQVKVDR